MANTTSRKGKYSLELVNVFPRDIRDRSLLLCEDCGPVHEPRDAGTIRCKKCEGILSEFWVAFKKDETIVDVLPYSILDERLLLCEDCGPVHVQRLDSLPDGLIRCKKCRGFIHEFWVVLKEDKAKLRLILKEWARLDEPLRRFLLDYLPRPPERVVITLWKAKRRRGK